MSLIRCSFCLLGPPASGKGTIGSLLQSTFNLDIIAPGEIYRKLREEDSEIGDIVRESLKDGGYCPDELTDRIMLDEAKRLHEKGTNGIILDGYPRTLKQLDFLLSNYQVDHFFHFHAPYEDLMHSAMNRIQCSGCNKVWSKYWNEDDCCDCSPRIWKERFDDSVDMYPKRYAVYEELTAPIIDVVNKFSNYHKLKSLGNANFNAEVLSFTGDLLTNRDSCH